MTDSPIDPPPISVLVWCCTDGSCADSGKGANAEYSDKNEQGNLVSGLTYPIGEGA